MKRFATVFGLRSSRQRSPKGFGATAPKHQTFLLEPILTPSGIIDGGEEVPDVADIPFPGEDIATDIDIDTDPVDIDADAGTDADTDVGADSDTDAGADSADIISVGDEDIPEADLEDVSFVTELSEDVSDSTSFQFEAGYFTVGEEGEVTVDYLFDGGKYQGELAIFSLEGMDDLEPGSEAFIQEAANRSLSDTEMGHVVISDKTEGARLDGSLGERKEWNKGDYQGAKTFQMNEGDRFGIMLVPNGRVEQVADNPGIGGSRTPVFSLVTANPDDALQMGQIVDVTGDGNTFVFEDKRLDQGSDQDYNDFIFQIRGATGETALMDDLVDPADDWRVNEPLGQEIIDYTASEATSVDNSAPITDIPNPAVENPTDEAPNLEDEPVDSNPDPITDVSEPMVDNSTDETPNLVGETVEGEDELSGEPEEPAPSQDVNLDSEPTEVQVDSGYFTVDASGEVTVDYLFDGGKFRGELAIFSLEGMESLEPGSEAFIQEAADRALRDSELGHIAISDSKEGARFSGVLGEDQDWNNGEYQGPKTLQMEPGERFGLMLVPNGKVEHVAENPAIGGTKTPLFSLTTANPDDAFHTGQVADITGDGSLFAFEDIGIGNKSSDQDYNDLIFQITGATSEAALMDDLVDPANDWRNSELGQQIIANAQPVIPEGKELPGDPEHPALPEPTVPLTDVDQGGDGIAISQQSENEPINPGGARLDSPTLIEESATVDLIDQVSHQDPKDIYQISSQKVQGAEVSVLSGNASVSILDTDGNVLSQQTLTRGTHSIEVPDELPDDVLLQFDSQDGNGATYVLKNFESQASEAFNIELDIEYGLTESQQEIIREAAASIESLIGEGLPSAIVDGQIIDDVKFKISVGDLDGWGGTQARTKIDFMRYGSLLPAQSLLEFDLEDIAELEESGQLFDVVRHEMLHGLGFGNLWEAKGLIDYAGTPLAQYNGENAVTAFQEMGGLTDTVPLEVKGNGSAGLHWNENLFQEEIMTADLGLSNGESAAISEVTLASLADLGYVVNMAAASTGYGLLGGAASKDFTPEQIEAFRQSMETSFSEPDEDFIHAVMPEVDPDKVSPEIWAHAERFAENGEYYDWVPYQVQYGDTFGKLASRFLGNASYEYYKWIGDKNGARHPYNWLYWDSNNPNNNWIKVPRHHPNYEWKQEQERLRRAEELRRRQEEEARRRREEEERLARERAEQERLAREEEARRQEAERRRLALEEQERRLQAELERRRQEEELRKEEERLRELERQREITRQEGKGGQDWFFAKSLPEFGPTDPFETKLTGETVGNLVPDDYYRFTLSRKGRIDARLMNLLADADLVLYDVRNRPISYSLREGITDEQILVDLLPGTYMLRVNSPEGKTTDYDLIVKFKHLLSRTEQGPPPGWKVGGGTTGNGSGSGTGSGPLFSDPRIQQIYDWSLAKIT